MTRMAEAVAVTRVAVDGAVLSSQGQKIVKEGKTLESDDENIAELTGQAQTFLDKQMPILKAIVAPVFKTVV